MDKIKEQIALLFKNFNRTLKCISKNNMITNDHEIIGAKNIQKKGKYVLLRRKSMLCYECKEFGHIQFECTNTKKKNFSFQLE